MTRKQLVLNELLSAYFGKEYFYNKNEKIPRGWVPSWVIISPEVGGLSGLRRLRELREAGIEIEHTIFYRHLPDGSRERTNTTIYRLITPPQYIDRENCKIIKAEKNGQLLLII